MINLEQIQQDINQLPEEAQNLLIDFIELLKKRYSLAKTESDLSTNYKSVLKEGLKAKYDHR